MKVMVLVVVPVSSAAAAVDELSRMSIDLLYSTTRLLTKLQVCVCVSA